MPGDAIDPSAAGSLGSGIYFTRVARQSAVYGEHVAVCHVTLRHPWTIDLDYESDLVYALDFDSPGLDAINTLPGGAALIEAARLKPFGHFGSDLTEVLRSLGYDGIVGKYADGSTELVAFDSEQVTIVRMKRFNPMRI